MQEKTCSTQYFWAELRRNHPNYIRWFAADTASALGASLIAVPMSLASLHITGNPGQAGIIGAVGSAGSMIMTIPAGMIIDRYDKKKLLLTYGLSQFVIWGLFSLLLHQGLFSFPLLLAFSAASGLILGVFGGLTNAILRFIIPENLLVQAQGRNQTRDSIIWMAGLPLGGFLYGMLPALPFVIQSLSGLGPLYAAKTITTKLTPDSASRRARYSFKEFWHDTLYSLTWIWKYPTLRTIFGIDIFSNFANFFLIVAIDLWLAYMGVPGWAIGVTSSMFTVGLIIGGLAQDRIIRLLPGWRIIQATMLWEVVWYTFLVAFSAHWPLIAVGAFFIVIPSIACNSYTGSYLALSAPPEKIGKCSAGARLAMGALPVIASASAGALLALVGFPISMILCSVCAVISCILAIQPSLRPLPTTEEFDTIQVCE